MELAFAIILMFILLLSAIFVIGGETKESKQYAISMFLASIVTLAVIVVWGK